MTTPADLRKLADRMYDLSPGPYSTGDWIVERDVLESALRQAADEIDALLVVAREQTEFAQRAYESVHLANSVAEAADSLLSELEGPELAHFNMFFVLEERLEDWRKAKGGA